MSRHARIHQLLTDALTPTHLEIIDDSASHAGHAGAHEGGESHYTIRIAAPSLQGLSRVAAHRAVFGALAPEMEGANAIHALRIEVL